jgi:hypothetical protein
MTGFLGVMVLVLKSENDDFFTFDQTFRSGQDLGAFNGRGTDGKFAIIRNEENFIQFNLISLSVIHQIDIDRFAGSDFILFSTRFNYSVNGTPPISQQPLIVADICHSMQSANNSLVISDYLYNQIAGKVSTQGSTLPTISGYHIPGNSQN